MRRSRLIRGATAAAAVVVLLAVGATPASAHVEPDPAEAPKGGSAEIAFRVPNERDDASTVQVVIAFPTDHPIPSASVLAMPGWKVTTEMTKLAKPLETDEGPVSEAVGRVTWSGGTIEPGQYGDFTVALESIPSDTDELVFKALQTYSDGEVVRWIEPTGPDGKEPDNPAPTVKLVAGGAEDDHASDTTTAPPTTADGTTSNASTNGDLATTDDVDSAKTVGIIGVVVGALGLILAVVAIASGRRRSPA